MFITGPDVIRETTGEITDRKSLGGAETHAINSGVAHLVTSDEPRASRLVKCCSNIYRRCEGFAPTVETHDASDRRNPTGHAFQTGPQRSRRSPVYLPLQTVKHSKSSRLRRQCCHQICPRRRTFRRICRQQSAAISRRARLKCQHQSRATRPILRQF